MIGKVSYALLPDRISNSVKSPISAVSRRILANMERQKLDHFFGELNDR